MSRPNSTHPGSQSHASDSNFTADQPRISNVSPEEMLKTALEDFGVRIECNNQQQHMRIAENNRAISEMSNMVSGLSLQINHLMAAQGVSGGGPIDSRVREGSLEDELRCLVRMLKPNNIQEAYSLAKIHEMNLSKSKTKSNPKNPMVNGPYLNTWTTSSGRRVRKRTFNQQEGTSSRSKPKKKKNNRSTIKKKKQVTPSRPQRDEDDADVSDYDSSESETYTEEEEVQPLLEPVPVPPPKSRKKLVLKFSIKKSDQSTPEIEEEKSTKQPTIRIKPITKPDGDVGECSRTTITEADENGVVPKRIKIKLKLKPA